jgi:hypothetical protein
VKKLAIAMLVLLAGALAACGQNEAQPEEVNAPESASAMQETEQQRDQQNLEQEQQKEIEEFDAAEQ